MRPLPAWLDSFRRSLALRLDRLRDTFHDLRARLRDTVVQAVGDTVADTVRDTLRVVLAAAPVTFPPSFPLERPFGQTPGFWGAPNDEGLDEDSPDPSFDDEPWDGDRLDHRLDDADDGRDVVPAGAPSSAVPSWPAAVAVGCQAAAWWLRRRQGRLPGLALGVGPIAGLAAFGGSARLTGSVSALTAALGLLS
jgi:hypothetical protein